VNRSEAELTFFLFNQWSSPLCHLTNSETQWENSVGTRPSSWGKVKQQELSKQFHCQSLPMMKTQTQ